MKLLEWDVSEDNYQEQINIPKTLRDMAAEEGISTENKNKVVVRLTNLTTGEEYLNRLAIKGSGKIRIRILG